MFILFLGHHFEGTFSMDKPIVQLATLMVIACHIILGVSRRGCHWLFSMCCYIVQTTLFAALRDNPFSAYFQAVLSGFPQDIRTATDKFNLDTKATVHAVCPKCHAMYKPTYEGETLIPIYQERCSFRRYSSRCGELLIHPRTVQNVRINVPIKTYITFDFKDWLSGLLARTGYEEKMDKAWERMAQSPGGILRDIFQGSTIRDFKGPDGATHFSHAGGEDAGQYLFSLGFDFFNPLGNKQSGKKVSIGVLILACVNLPIEECYKPENMFVAGIISGPNEPKLDQINPYLTPIVDAFLEFWNGVHFTCTCMYTLGRLVFCALIVVICDLPVACKIGGFSACSHEYFCSVCWCNKMQDGYSNFDSAKWKRRTNEDCRQFAERFHAATDAKSAASSFDRTGLQWSELLRLPYYDPTRFLVVDPMHNLFLGLIKEHFQGILGYYPPNTAHPSLAPRADIHINISSDPTNPLPDGKEVRASVRRLISWLEEPFKFTDENSDKFKSVVKKWGKSNIHVVAFVYVGRGLNCLPQTLDSTGRNTALPFAKKLSKTDLAMCILSWVSNRLLVECTLLTDIT